MSRECTIEIPNNKGQTIETLNKSHFAKKQKFTLKNGKFEPLECTLSLFCDEEEVGKVTLNLSDYIGLPDGQNIRADIFDSAEKRALL